MLLICVVFDTYMSGQKQVNVLLTKPGAVQWKFLL